MSKKEEWVEKSLDVDTYINSAIPSDDFTNRLKSIPNSFKANYAIIPKKFIWAAAASISLLISLNLFSANSYSSQSENYVSTTETIDSDFDFLNQI